MNKYLIAFVLLMPFIGICQDISPGSKVPLDPAVRYGKLDNGLSYYIRHNEEPKERASFYIIQNVGAILEDDNQNGLAHFLEHMAFNGTKNFPKNGIIDYLEKYGVAFGRNINAYTSLDETVYNISNVPVNHQPLLDSCLLILHDWSNNLLLNGEDIDEERGVISEEWRTRRDASFRLRNKLMPYMYKGSQYAKRDVIGDLDVIKNFDHDVIRKFYKDWYRTDQQAIVIVGDIDAANIEKQIKELFSGIPAVNNPIERKYYDIPDNNEPIVGIATDPETQQTIVQMLIKHDPVKPENKGVNYLRQNIVNSLYSSMINGRLNELVQKENPPFVAGFISYGPFTKTKDAYMLGCLAKNKGIEEGLNAVLLENERIIRHGFTASEFEREKINLLRSTESRYKERNKIQNDAFISQYQSHFLNGTPAPGIEYLYNFTNTVIQGISLEEINDLAKQYYSEENIVVVVMAPENVKESIPDEESIIKVIKNIKNVNVEAYEDEASDSPLIAEIPQGSEVVKTKDIEEFNAVEWTLGNGVKVVIKSTDFKEDEIIMSAFSNGGMSLIPDNDIASASIATTMLSMYGLGEFDAISLNKKLAGKIVSVSPTMSNLYEGFSGGCSPKDFETMLQLIYMYFTALRFDEQAHNTFIGRLQQVFENQVKSPDQIFGDSINMIMNSYHPRVLLQDKELLDKIEFSKIETIIKDRFQDASDFTFIFTGNINLGEVKPLIEKYLGGIRDIEREESWKDNNMRPPENDLKRDIFTEMETPKSSAYVNLHREFKYTPENKIYFDFIKGILELRYNEEIREKEGGTYGVSVNVSKNHYPEETYQLVMMFDCDPERAEELIDIIYREIDMLKKDGPSEEDLDKTKKNLLKNLEEGKRRNPYWHGAINNYYMYGQNLTSDENSINIIENVTVNNLAKKASELFSGSTKAELILRPKK